jgi:hypothetical protein
MQTSTSIGSVYALGKQYGGCVTSTATDRYRTSGVGKDSAGMPAVARSIKTRQIWAGKVPPNTVIRVRGGSMGICP